MILPRSWCLGLVLAWAVSARGQVSEWNQSDGLFRDDGLATRLVFSPETPGRDAFSDAPTSPPVLAVREETRCNALSIVAERSSYKFHPGEPWERTSEQRDGYYARLESMLTRAGLQGITCQLVLTRPFFESKKAISHFHDWLTSAVVSERIPAPLVLMDAGGRAGAASLAARFHRDVPWMCVGEAIHTARTGLSFPADYVAVDSLSGSRGQSEVSFWKSVAGQVPVILRRTVPDFRGDLCRFVSGAAGIVYTGFPPVGSKGHANAWRGLRGVSSFVSQFGGIEFSPANEWFSPELEGVFRTGSSGLAVLLKPGYTGGIRVPDPPDGLPDRLCWWYHPLTDQSIILPSRPAGEGRLRVMSPSPGRWVLCVRNVPAAGDSVTTTTDIPRENAY